MRLIHYGDSFAVGNAVPSYIPGLESGAYIHKQLLSRRIEIKHDVKIKQVTNCGKIIANRLNLAYEMMAENGASNEKIMRELLGTDLTNSFVLIGITSGNRREALTTSRTWLGKNSHWQTWKMVGPKEPKKFKNLAFDPWGNDHTVALETDAQCRTIIQILYMQNFLKANKVPYLMFNALYNGFDTPLNREAKDLLMKVDTRFFMDLTGGARHSQHGWCLANKDYVVSDLDEHPNIKGQKAWAEKLLPLVTDIIQDGLK